MNHWIHPGLLVLTLGLLAGCGSTSQRTTPPAPVVSSQSSPVSNEPRERDIETRAYSGAAGETPELQSYEPVVDATATRPSHSGAVLALLDDAGNQQRSGDLAGAVSTVERALRIEPRSAQLWQELALLRHQQGRYRMAADLAAKSNSLAGEDRVLRRQNWQLIARARRALGDETGADAAQRQARTLR